MTTFKVPPQSYFDRVNGLLFRLQCDPQRSPESRAAGAYCLGLSGIIWERTGKAPHLRVLKMLAACSSVAEGLLVVDAALGGDLGQAGKDWDKPGQPGI